MCLSCIYRNSSTAWIACSSARVWLLKLDVFITVLALLPRGLAFVSPWYVVHQPKSARAPHCLLVTLIVIVFWVSSFVSSWVKAVLDVFQHFYLIWVSDRDQAWLKMSC
jgi:hypothetical protein